MSINAPKVTLAAATPTLIASGKVGSAAEPVSVLVWNATSANLYLGGPTNDGGSTQGIPVAASSFSPSFDLWPGDDLYAYSAAGGVVNVITTRN